MRSERFPDLSSLDFINYSNKFTGMLRVSCPPLYLTIIYGAGKIEQRLTLPPPNGGSLKPLQSKNINH